jgi:hypothetical protein
VAFTKRIISVISWLFHDFCKKVATKAYCTSALLPMILHV